jgi:DNA-binding MarR family transcriptional regulator
MHSLSFRLKRAHHRVVAFGKSILRRFGLTPARFDLLYVVYVRWEFRKRVYDAPAQTDLCRALGVTAATVSRMVGRLEQLGIVTRFGSRIDRRTKQVALTPEGLALLREAVDEILEEEVVERAYQRALRERTSAGLEPFDLEPSAELELELELAVAELKGRVEKIARAFGDTSTLSYAPAWRWLD